MSVTANTTGFTSGDLAGNARNSMFNKVTWAQSDSVYINLIKQQRIKFGDSGVDEFGMQLKNDNTNRSSFNYEQVFNNVTLKQLREYFNISDIRDGHWIANVDEDYGRITLKNVKVSQKNDEHSMTHEHLLFESINFRDLVITLDIDGEERKLYLDRNSSNFDQLNPIYDSKHIGFNGRYNSTNIYQTGVCQNLGYLIRCADTIIDIAI